MSPTAKTAIEVIEETETKDCDQLIPQIQNDINHKFLEGILEKRVSKFHVKTGSNPGDNFTSILFAVQVWLEDPEEKEPLNLLIKTYPALEARQKFLNETNLFMKEVNVYQEYVPDLIRFQEKMGPQQQDLIRLAVPTFLAGKAVDYAKDNNSIKEFTPVAQLDNYLVMTDMRKCGEFQMTDKKLGLDFDHTVLAIKELAKTHALGWALKQKERLPNLLHKYPYFIEMCFNRCDLGVADMVDANFKLIHEMVKTKCEGNSRILEGIEKIGKIGPMEILCSFITNDGTIDEEKVCQYLDLGAKENSKFFSDPWVVSCHGDSWVNNMLFKYDSNSRPTEMIFVDLQMYREGCPTTDLAYMLYSSTTYEVRNAHLKTFLKVYCEEFLGYCNRLEVAPLKNFTFENLLWRFKRAKIFGFVTSCLVLPIILTSDDDALADLDKAKVKSTGEVKVEGDAGLIGGSNTCEKRENDDIADIFKSLTASSGKNEILADRMMGIVNELMNDNIF